MQKVAWSFLTKGRNKMAKGNKIRLTLEIDTLIDVYNVKDALLKKVKEVVPDIMSLQADVSEIVIKKAKEE